MLKKIKLSTALILVALNLTSCWEREDTSKDKKTSVPVEAKETPAPVEANNKPQTPTDSSDTPAPAEVSNEVAAPSEVNEEASNKETENLKPADELSKSSNKE